MGEKCARSFYSSTASNGVVVFVVVFSPNRIGLSTRSRRRFDRRRRPSLLQGKGTHRKSITKRQSQEKVLENQTVVDRKARQEARRIRRRRRRATRSKTRGKREKKFEFYLIFFFLAHEINSGDIGSSD